MDEQSNGTLQARSQAFNETEGLIADETYSRPANGTMTVCVLTLHGGAQVMGYSNVVDPDDFSPEIGRRIARGKAVTALIECEGYHRKRMKAETLFRAARGGYAAINTGFDALDSATMNAWVRAAGMALDMHPDDDVPDVIVELAGGELEAARFAVVARAVAGL